MYELLDIWDLLWDALFWVLDTLAFWWEDMIGFFRNRRERKKNHRENWEKAAVFNWCKCHTCVEYYEWKDSKVNSVGGGGAWGSPGRGQGPPYSGSFTIRCASCKGPIFNGLCSNCGPAAGIQYVASMGSSGGAGGQGGSSSISSGTISPTFLLCMMCSTPIPSGTCCSLACLRLWDPSLRIYQSSKGCMDCGSDLAPTYHAGCTQAGRVTAWLPVPGPYGSNGLTQTQAAPPRKPIPVAGMQGYSERGTPDDWDMAIGTIRGYRWFKIEIPESWAGIRSREVRTGYYDATGKPDVQDEGMLELSDAELPSLFGAFGGQWDDGVNEAKCRRSSRYSAASGFTHAPPETREACGCGFWAYFDENLPCSQVLSQWQQGGAGMRGIAVLGCVEGSGRVIVGEKGFRSQYAQIAALTIGQVAVPGLMYWTDPTQNGYGRGPGGSYGNASVQCSDSELYVRLAKIEDMLARKYPSARIMSSEANLRGMFPPDENYRSK